MEKINDRLLNWASILEDTTREQALRTAEMPFIYPHLALMPDAHLGKGATVGSVIPTEGAIIPAAVGVDIGCGMMAPSVGITEPTVAPSPRCASGMSARCGRTNGIEAVRSACSRVLGSRMDAQFSRRSLMVCMVPPSYPSRGRRTPRRR